jgi:uncharacterized protein
MGKMLNALLQLQSVERDLMLVKRRLQTRKNSVAIQQKKIDQLRSDFDALHDKSMNRRKDADRFELDLKQKDAQVQKLRTALNAAKSNKEYAAILTEINTHKADNAKLEEEVLKIMAEVDVIKVDSEKIKVQLQAEEGRLAEVQKSSGDEIERLNRMLEQLTAQRAEAAKQIPPDVMAKFERLSISHEGEAMAVIEIHGKRPPFDYVCGGCFMTLNAEHANVLRTRDEVRTCDNCKRILYMEAANQGATKE